MLIKRIEFDDTGVLRAIEFSDDATKADIIEILEKYSMVSSLSQEELDAMHPPMITTRFEATEV